MEQDEKLVTLVNLQYFNSLNNVEIQKLILNSEVSLKSYVDELVGDINTVLATLTTPITVSEVSE